MIVKRITTNFKVHHWFTDCTQSLVTNNVKELRLPCFEPETSNITIHTPCPDWAKGQSTVCDSIVLATVPAIIITLAEGVTSIIVVDGQTKETVVSSISSVVEVPAAETTVSFEAYNTHTSVSAAIFGVDLSVQTLDAGKFTFSIDGSQVEATNSFATTFSYPGTTLELSFSARQTAFQFIGEGSTEITIPSEHTHVTVDGIETAVDIPGFTTTLTVTGSSNVIVNLPATTAQMTIPEATYVFSAVTDSVVTGEGATKYCGTFTDQTVDGDQNSPCVMGALFTVTLPSDASALYLHATGLTTSFALQGITTTFIPE